MDAPFAVDGEVDAEKCEELLAVGAEHDVLDYKRTLNLSKRSLKDRVGFTKDVAAFSTLPSGGYILVGADSAGALAFDLAEIDRAHFDQATLLDIAASYLDGQLHIVSKVHEILGRLVALIFIGPSLDAFPPVAKKNGTFSEPGGEERTEFRRGDIFARVGTSSRRLQHKDWVRVLANQREQVRSEVARDTQEIIARVAESLRAGEAGLSPTRNALLDVAMAPDAFNLAVSRALESGATQTIQRTLRTLRAEVSATCRSSDNWSSTQAALDRIAAIGGASMLDGNDAAFDLAIEAFEKTYRSALESPGATYAAPGQEREAASLWRDIAARVLALLSLAVRGGTWKYVRPLVLQQIGSDPSSRYRSWLRHAIACAAGANVLVKPRSGEVIGGAIIRFAREVVTAVPILREGVEIDETDYDIDAQPKAEDRLLDSVCQADFLWCLVVVAEAKSDNHHEFYPNCSAFYVRRTLPVVQLLVSDDRLRRLVIPDDDQVFADAIVGVDGSANAAEGFRSWSVRTGEVERFIEAAGS